MVPRARAALIACLPGLALACGAAAPGPPPAPAAPPSAAEPVPPISPARWLVPYPGFVERSIEGLDRAVVAGRRVELDGMEIVHAAAGDPDLDGGARAPGWAPQGPARYLFWSGKRLYGAERWGSPLHPIATLPADVRGAFDWLGGEGLLLTTGGALAVPTSGAAPAPLGLPGVMRAVAADARRALAVTALGHALLTTDGGRSYRDVTAELGAAPSVEVRGDAIAVTLPGGGERSITASGAVADTAPAAPVSHHRPPDEPDRLGGGAAGEALGAAVERGLPLPDGGIVVAARGAVGRFDPAALRTGAATSLDPGLERATCVAFRAADAPLLACSDGARAALVDLTGAPRTERTFDVPDGADADAFAGADGEAIGFLGPCEGGPARPRGPEIYTYGAPRNRSHQRSTAFCVRAGRDAWVEHRVGPEDEADVIAWIPRAGGGAVAVVARHASFLDDADRVTRAGPLRIVRVGRTEPPLQIPGYTFTPRVTLDRSLRVRADDVIEGWLPNGGSGAALISVTIDTAGRVRAHDAPEGVQAIAAAGRFALGADRDGRLFETLDGGTGWRAIPGPFGRLARTDVPSACSPAGCRVGHFVRLGWSGPDAPAPPPAEGADLDATRARVRPGAALPPLARLSCTFAGAPEGRRVAESAALGFTPSPQQRNGPLVHIGTIGFAAVPWNGPQAAPTGDADLAWVTPLDLAAKLNRKTIPLAQIGAAASKRLYDLRVGYVLGEDGRVSTLATGYRDQCQEGLLASAGVVRSLGGCADDPAVGVDVGGRVLVLHWAFDGIAVLAAGAPAAADRRGARDGAIAAGLHELSRVPTSWMTRGLTLGAGVRAGAPVAVMVDGTGEAALAPIDPDRGTLGPEERLRPLAEAQPGGAPACAPSPADARVVLPFEGLFGIDPASMPGVTSAGGAGVAVLRWSAARACVDGIEAPVHDTRYEDNPGPYQVHGLEKAIARFAGPGAGATLLVVGAGWELRQKLACAGISPARGGAP